jgi:hypothetical protein
MSITIKNIQRIEEPHSHLPSLTPFVMDRIAYHFTCDWEGRRWIIELHRNADAAGRYPLILKYGTLFITMDVSHAMLVNDNFLRHNVKTLIRRLKEKYKTL